MEQLMWSTDLLAHYQMCLGKVVYLSGAARDGIPLVVFIPPVWCPLAIIHPEIHSKVVSFSDVHKLT